MTLTQEQIKEFKQQLSEQIKHLPLEQKLEAQKQIDSMSPEALETMLRQESQAKIFRQIASKEIHSKIINENNEAIAVLEIRPISEGHTIIIPKKPIKKIAKIPKEILKFVKESAEKISLALKPKKIEIQPASQLGEIIINLIPIYKNPLNINSPRAQSNEEELDKIYRKITQLKIINLKPQLKKKIKKEKSREIRKIKRRIP